MIAIAVAFVLAVVTPVSLGAPIARVVAGLVPLGRAYRTDGCGLRLAARDYARPGGTTTVATVFSVTGREALAYVYGGNGVATAIYAAGRRGHVRYIWHGGDHKVIRPTVICALVQQDARP